MSLRYYLEYSLNQSIYNKWQRRRGRRLGCRYCRNYWFGMSRWHYLEYSLNQSIYNKWQRRM